jgi:hypothetical protein
MHFNHIEREWFGDDLWSLHSSHHSAITTSNHQTQELTQEIDQLTDFFEHHQPSIIPAKQTLITTAIARLNITQ